MHRPVTAKSSASSQHGVRRRVAWSNDCGLQLSTVYDEAFVDDDDVPAVDTDITRNSHSEDTLLRNNTGDFEPETDFDAFDPAIFLEDMRERRADEVVSTAARNQRVSFMIECDRDVTATSSRSDVEMSDFSDPDGSDNRN